MDTRTLINNKISKERQREILDNLYNETEIKIVRLEHQNLAFDELVLTEKVEKLGKLEKESINSKKEENVKAINTCLEDLDLIKKMIAKLD